VEKQNKKEKIIKTSKYDSITAKEKSKGNKISLLPALILNLTRISLILKAYTTHELIDNIYLLWVILSFLLSNEICIIISISSILPLMSFEFILIYAANMPIVKDSLFVEIYVNFLSGVQFNYTNRK